MTDSRLHHHLLQSKARRGAPTASGFGEDLLVGDHHVAHSTAMGLVDDVLPRHALERIEFDELLRFRERTKSARADFVRELRSKLNAMGPVPSEEFERAEAGLRVSLAYDLRQYRAELAMNRDKCWPSLAGALSATLPTGGAAAIAMSYLGLPQQAVAAAGAAAGHYLSQVKERFGE